MKEDARDKMRYRLYGLLDLQKETEDLFWADEYNIHIWQLCYNLVCERESDIDILVRFDKNANVTLFKYIGIVNALQSLLHKKIDLVEEGQLKDFAKESAEQDKILIYEREA